MLLIIIIMLLTKLLRSYAIIIVAM